MKRPRLIEKSCLGVVLILGILQPSPKRIQGNDFSAAGFLPGLGRFVPGGKLRLFEVPCLDPGKTPLVLPAVLLENLVAPAALRPRLDGDGAAAELPGRAGTAAILCCNPSGDGEVSPAAPAPPDGDPPPDTFPERNQVPNRVGG